MRLVSDDWQYEIVIYREDWQSVEEWCADTFGDFGLRWYKLGIDPAQWILDDDFETTWYFKNEADAVLFKLKWA
jgi:hypothetical protein